MADSSPLPKLAAVTLYQSAKQAAASSAKAEVRLEGPHHPPALGLKVWTTQLVEALVMLVFLFTLVLAFGGLVTSTSPGCQQSLGSGSSAPHQASWGNCYV